MDTRAKIDTVLRDITDMAVNAIVNAANANLTPGVRVAGTIRKKGGNSIQKECDMIGPIPRGEAAVTRAGKLKLKYVIHAAGMHLGGKVSKMSLRDATLISLNRADEKGGKSIAFPAIGTGVGGLSPERCAKVMIDTVSQYLNNKKFTIEKAFLFFLMK